MAQDMDDNKNGEEQQAEEDDEDNNVGEDAGSKVSTFSFLFSRGTKNSGGSGGGRRRGLRERCASPNNSSSDSGCDNISGGRTAVDVVERVLEEVSEAAGNVMTAVTKPWRTLSFNGNNNNNNNGV